MVTGCQVCERYKMCISGGDLSEPHLAGSVVPGTGEVGKRRICRMDYLYIQYIEFVIITVLILHDAPSLQRDSADHGHSIA